MKLSNILLEIFPKKWHFVYGYVLGLYSAILITAVALRIRS